MPRPTFLHAGAFGHVRAAAAHAAAALRHLALALWAVVGHAIALAVAVVVVFEEWGWHPLARLLGRLAKLRPVAALEETVRRLPPYGALAVFALPSILILPLKLTALYLIGQGHTVSAASLFIGAKIAGTALLARLFMLTEPALMQILWFRRAYDVVMPLKHALTDWVRSSTVWKTGRVFKQRAKDALRPYANAMRARISVLRARLFGR
jgi:hypothetical protein